MRQTARGCAPGLFVTAPQIMRESLEARKASRGGERAAAARALAVLSHAGAPRLRPCHQKLLCLPACPASQAELDARMAAKHGAKLLCEQGHVHDVCCGGEVERSK